MHRRQRQIRGRRQVRGRWPVAAPAPLPPPAAPLDVRVVNRGVEAAVREHDLRVKFPYVVVERLLTTATVDQEVEFSGTHISFLQASSNNARVSVKVRGVESDPVELRRGDTWAVDFDKLYLSWDAQPGRTGYLLLEFDAR